VKLAVSGGLLAWLLHKAGLGQVGSQLRGAHIGWLLAALALGFLSTCVQTTQWRALLRASGLLRTWRRCLRLVFVGNVFNTVLPTSIGGDVARAVMVAETPQERLPAASTVVLQRLCNFPGMLVLMALGLVLTTSDANAGHVRPVALAFIALGAVGLLVCMSPLLGWLSRRPLLQRGRPARAIAGLLGTLDAFRDRRRELVMASGRGTSFWALSILNQWAFMHAVGVDAGIAYAAIVVTTVNLLTMLPVSINGYGVREGGFSAFLVVGSLATRQQAVSVGIVVAAQSLLWAGIGVACLLSLPERRRKLRAEQASLLLESTA